MDSAAPDFPIEEKLREVYDKTDSREYAEALDCLEATRIADPGNIYISALKRQLEALLSLSQADDLSEDRRHELMDPMQGIIECAVRDNHRQHTAADDAQPREAPPPAAEPPREDEQADAQKQLEALKLLYFQRASKFVMKGEYEQALAEVRRVFVVDPENTIAREYASRVEQLIEHARRLAAAPDEAAPPAAATPEAIEPAPAQARRHTAWDDDFLAPRPTSALPEHRPAPTSARQTMAYGDRLAVGLAASRDDGHQEHAPRKKSKIFLLLAAVILTPLLAGVAIAVFSSKNGAAVARTDRGALSAQNTTTSAAATMGAAVNPAPEQAQPVPEEHAAGALSAPAATAPAPEQKPAPAHAAAIHDAAPEVRPPAAQSVSSPQTGTAVQPSKMIAAVTPAQPPAASAPASPSPAASVPVTPAPQTPPPAFVAVEKDPQIVRLEKPEFPSFVWRMGGEGQVVIRVLIDANGKPLDSQILKSTNPVFEQPVVDAVMKSQFNPAQMGQGPVAAWLTIPFKFRQPK